MMKSTTGSLIDRIAYWIDEQTYQSQYDAAYAIENLFPVTCIPLRDDGLIGFCIFNLKGNDAWIIFTKTFTPDRNEWQKDEYPYAIGISVDKKFKLEEIK